jgi:hypothetical protein
MKKIFVAQHPAEAHLVRGALASSGIEAWVMGESLFSVRGETPITPDTLPSVWVADEDEERARSVLDEVRQSAGNGTSLTWICRRCGERVEPQFAMCWNCGEPH